MNDKGSMNDIAVVLSGEAGQGINTIENLLAHVLKRQGYYMFTSKEYMSRVRGGCNSTLVRISDRPVEAYVERIDLLIPLIKESIPHLRARIGSKTLIAGSPDILQEAVGNGSVDDGNCFEIAYDDIAKEAGSKLYANTAAAGLVFGILAVNPELISEYFKEKFEGKGEKVQQGNIDAAMKGYEQGRELGESGRMDPRMGRDGDRASDLLLTGAQAVGLGALAGGCNFIGAYPMSPATGVIQYLAQQSGKFDLVVEQVEDEIAAINMCIGAWFAGARAMTTTSGGGFALMCEGMSLAAMFESPLVVHLAQRPGPATGLPTRTEQGDLELAVYAGHGEYARVVLAPGNLEQAYAATAKAFDMADKLQIPVVILTDQYLMDSYASVNDLPVPDAPPAGHIVETEADYARYRLTDDGLSPRGIPGYGRGLVSLDSDTHDEEGHITEDLELRNKMVEKRLKRFELIDNETLPPELIGDAEAPNLLICWGATRGIVCEAVAKLDRPDIAVLHFQQVFPLPPGTEDLLAKAERRVVLEGNATGQFAKLLKLHANAKIDGNILKYNGMPYSVEEVMKAVENEFGGED